MNFTVILSSFYYEQLSFLSFCKYVDTHVSPLCTPPHKFTLSIHIHSLLLIFLVYFYSYSSRLLISLLYIDIIPSHALQLTIVLKSKNVEKHYFHYTITTTVTVFINTVLVVLKPHIYLFLLQLSFDVYFG